MRILVADDEPDMVKVLAAILENEHYAVDTVLDGRSALDYALSGGYDCLVLDIMMPRMSGLEVVRELRSRGEAVPILLLTAKGEPADRIAGLDVGADDYLAKPFVMGEFLARVRACTRRSTMLVPTVLEVGDLMLDRTSFSLSCPATGRGPIRLANKEYLIMEQLMRHAGRFVTPDQLRDQVWGFDAYVEPNVIWTHISHLRRALRELGSTSRIANGRGRGYALES